MPWGKLQRLCSRCRDTTSKLNSAAIYFFVSLPSSTVFQVVPSGEISNLKL